VRIGIRVCAEEQKDVLFSHAATSDTAIMVVSPKEETTDSSSKAAADASS